MPSSALERNQQILTWGSAFLFGISIGRWLGHLRDRRREPRLSTVGESARLIAAWRAVENLETDGKLFTDELAITLAGHRAFSEALAGAEAIDIDADASSRQARRMYKISQVAARSWWFDRQIMTALTSPAVPASKGWLSARLTNSARGPSAPPRQVVVLGAGMDSRPWRLPLPPNVSWFEIDQSEVVAEKKRALVLASAEVPGSNTSALAQFALRCSSWCSLAIDVTDTESMVEELCSNGLDVSQPCVWVLEGLLMYLEPSHVEKLLTTLATVSAPGSTLIGHDITNTFMEEVMGNYKTPEQADGSVQQPVTDPKYSLYPPKLLRTWKSSVDSDPSAMLASWGWKQHLVCTRATIAAQVAGGVSTPGVSVTANGGVPAAGRCAFETREGLGEDRYVVFFVAKKQ